MELYTISKDTHRRETLIENYESFVWTDRYSSFGELELIAEPSRNLVDRLKPGIFMGFDKSKHVMRIDSALENEDEQGKKRLTVKARSLEALLLDRVAKKSWELETWDFFMPPSMMVSSMVSTICVLGQGVSPWDVIPYLTAPIRRDSATQVRISVKTGYLYDRIKEICDTYDLGFRILKPKLGSPDLIFEPYTGTDRTGVNGVAFSPDLESLSQPSYLESLADFKNTAYVFNNNVRRIVYAPGYNDVQGVDRRVLLVDASDINNLSGAALTAAMTQRGLDALSSHKALRLFDGVVNPNNPHKYDTHYFLGDLVRLIGNDGKAQKVRVTEHIWSADATGFNSYPTLSAL